MKRVCALYVFLAAMVPLFALAESLSPEEVLSRFYEATLNADMQSLIRYGTAEEGRGLQEMSESEAKMALGFMAMTMPKEYRITGREDQGESVVFRLGAVGSNAVGEASIIRENGEWRVKLVDWSGGGDDAGNTESHEIQLDSIFSAQENSSMRDESDADVSDQDTALANCRKLDQGPGVVDVDRAKKAAACYAAIIANEPRNADAYYGLGVSHYLVGFSTQSPAELEISREALKKSLEIAPANAKAKSQLMETEGWLEMMAP